MKTKRMSRDVWEMHIWKWRKTNLTINEYCSKNSLARSNFYKWKAIFEKSKEEPETKGPSEFIPIKVQNIDKSIKTEQQVDPPVKLSFTSPSGHVVSVESTDFNLMIKFYSHLRDLR